MKFPVNTPLITDADIESVVNNLKSTWISGESEIIDLFEREFAVKVNAAFGIAVSNGSNALELAFAALDLKPGDEVILPSFTIISCLAPILRMGLVPIFVDSDEVTWNMSAEEILSKVTTRTRAILVVHTYGLAVNMEPILQLCKAKNIFLIEDCAEVHGVNYKNSPCGSFGDIATFSFYSNKLITTGEGGMCVTSNPELNLRLRKLRNLGFEPEVRFKHSLLGYNFRMTGMQAALGLSQLTRIDEHLAHKREIASRYISNFRKYEQVSFQPEMDRNSRNSFWVFGLYIKKSGITSEVIRQNLEEKGVGTRPFFYPLHMQPLLANYQFKDQVGFAVSEDLWRYGFYLPTGNGMPIEDVQEISDLVEETFSDLGIL